MNLTQADEGWELKYVFVVDKSEIKLIVQWFFKHKSAWMKQLRMCFNVRVYDTTFDPFTAAQITVTTVSEVATTSKWKTQSASGECGGFAACKKHRNVVCLLLIATS